MTRTRAPRAAPPPARSLDASRRAGDQPVRIEHELRIAVRVERGAARSPAWPAHSAGSGAARRRRGADEAVDAEGRGARRSMPAITTAEARRRGRAAAGPPAVASDASGAQRDDLPVDQTTVSRCAVAHDVLGPMRRLRCTASSGMATAAAGDLDDQRVRATRATAARSARRWCRAPGSVRTRDLAAQALGRLAHHVEADAAAGHLGHRCATC